MFNPSADHLYWVRASLLCWLNLREGIAREPLTLSPAASSSGTFCCDTCTEISCSDLPLAWALCKSQGSADTRGLLYLTSRAQGCWAAALLSPWDRASFPPAGCAGCTEQGCTTQHNIRRINFSRQLSLVQGNAFWIWGWVPACAAAFAVQLLKGLAVWCCCTQC